MQGLIYFQSSIYDEYNIRLEPITHSEKGDTDDIPGRRVQHARTDDLHDMFV